MSDSSPMQSGGLQPGASVRVIDGTFVGYQGRIIRPDEARRLGLRNYAPAYGVDLHLVMLSIFGQDVPVELMGWQFERF
jgi:transcription antitermination factor NusG